MSHFSQCSQLYHYPHLPWCPSSTDWKSSWAFSQDSSIHQDLIGSSLLETFWVRSLLDFQEVSESVPFSMLLFSGASHFSWHQLKPGSPRVESSVSVYSLFADFTKSHVWNWSHLWKICQLISNSYWTLGASNYFWLEKFPAMPSLTTKKIPRHEKQFEFPHFHIKRHTLK